MGLYYMVKDPISVLPTAGHLGSDSLKTVDSKLPEGLSFFLITVKPFGVGCSCHWENEVEIV